MILGDITQRIVKTVKSSEKKKTFDGLGGLYRPAIMVGVGLVCLTASSSKED